MRGLHQFRDDLFGQSVFFFSSQSHAEFCRLLKTEFSIKKKVDEGIAGECVSTKEDIIIWVKSGGSLAIRGTVAHEVTHAALFLIKERGLPRHDELIAYIVGYITTKIEGVIHEALLPPFPHNQRHG